MKRKIGVIVQARMGSSRLPGKVLKKLGGKSVLENVVERLKYCENVNVIIVATTDNVLDDAIEDVCVNANISVFRGSEFDVLERYYQAAKLYNLDIIVRVTSDCPLISPDIVDKVIERLIEESADYSTNSLPPSYARGLECSAMTFDALEISRNKAERPYYREHVVTYIRENEVKFKIVNVINADNDTRFRITLDEQKDYTLLNMIYNALYKENEIINVNDALKYIHRNDLYGINEDVEQRS